jgi:plastocyanin
MHSLALQLTPVLAAEKSKVPFYIAGGLLVAWALLVSLGIGMRRPDFPSSVAGQRGVVAITAVLVVAAASTAVLTSESPTKTEPVSAGTKTEPTAPIPVVGTPVPAGSAAPAAAGAPAAGAPAATTGASAGKPTATTGTPTPPSSPAAGKGATALALAANPTGALSYNTKQLSAKAGTVTITMANMSPVEHNLTVALGSKVLGATPTFVGGTKALKLQLQPGKYTFYCSVPGHRQAGMEGTLTVS